MPRPFTRIARATALTTTLGVALTLPLAPAAVAQTTASESPWSLTSIVAGVLRSVVSYGRMVADVRYASLESNSARGEIVLRDLKIAGVGEYSECKISLGKLQVSGLSLLPSEEMQSRLDISDLLIQNNCFGPNAAMIGVFTGSDAIPIATLTMDIRQSAGSGAATIDIEAHSPGMARIEGSADFDYIAMYSPELVRMMMSGGNSYDPYGDPWADPGAMPEQASPSEPTTGLRGTLRSAHLSVTDLGLYQRMNVILPPEYATPEGMASLVTAPPGTALNEVQQGFVDSLQAFIAAPGTVTAELRPAEPLAFATTDWTTPEDAAAALKPAFTNAAPTPPVALIADPSDDSDARALGLAFATGNGVPQNTERALQLLTPHEDDGAVALILADLHADDDPAAAYGFALKAAATGAEGAVAALDRAEARLSVADLLDAQTPADSEIEEDSFASVVALREAAMAYDKGTSVPRSYALAWRLASLAAATGDSPSRSLMERIDARLGGEAAWVSARNEAASAALNDWSSRQLAAKLTGN
ncbi:sel1 repeat family protein [Paracoccus caeni]|uniref:Sel1 repeat family protein n=1 Tax=Paracoccus caeni TaxID=657651 RepID=A0A934VTW5_9RHOB|nr:sel1 repeat family protein [Paracoccus caeni]MBK4215176.1 sel1 repeat family protein [Paracoccus caeni]